MKSILSEQRKSVKPNAAWAKRYNLQDELRYRLAEVHAIREREESIAARWVQNFEENTAEYVRIVQSYIKEIQERKNLVLAWHKNGEREWTLKEIERFNKKREWVRERKVKEEAAELDVRNARLHAYKQTFEQCVKEIRDAVAWHLHGPQQTSSNKSIQMLRRRQLMSVLGWSPNSPLGRLLLYGKETLSEEEELEWEVEEEINKATRHMTRTSVVDLSSSDVCKRKDDTLANVSDSLMGMMFAPTQEEKLLLKAQKMVLREMSKQQPTHAMEQREEEEELEEEQQNGALYEHKSETENALQVEKSEQTLNTEAADNKEIKENEDDLLQASKVKTLNTVKKNTENTAVDEQYVPAAGEEDLERVSSSTVAPPTNLKTLIHRLSVIERENGICKSSKSNSAEAGKKRINATVGVQERKASREVLNMDAENKEAANKCTEQLDANMFTSDNNVCDSNTQAYQEHKPNLTSLPKRKCKTTCTDITTHNHRNKHCNIASNNKKDASKSSFIKSAITHKNVAMHEPAVNSANKTEKQRTCTLPSLKSSYSSLSLPARANESANEKSSWNTLLNMEEKEQYKGKHEAAMKSKRALPMHKSEHIALPSLQVGKANERESLPAVAINNYSEEKMYDLYTTLLREHAEVLSTHNVHSPHNKLLTQLKALQERFNNVMHENVELMRTKNMLHSELENVRCTNRAKCTNSDLRSETAQGEKIFTIHDIEREHVKEEEKVVLAELESLLQVKRNEAQSLQANIVELSHRIASERQLHGAICQFWRHCVALFKRACNALPSASTSSITIATTEKPLAITSDNYEMNVQNKNANAAQLCDHEGSAELRTHENVLTTSSMGSNNAQGQEEEEEDLLGTPSELLNKYSSALAKMEIVTPGPSNSVFNAELLGCSLRDELSPSTLIVSKKLEMSGSADGDVNKLSNESSLSPSPPSLASPSPHMNSLHYQNTNNDNNNIHNTKEFNKEGALEQKEEVDHVSLKALERAADTPTNVHYGNAVNENMIDFGKASSTDSPHQHDRHRHRIDSKKSKEAYAALNVNVEPLRFANLTRIDEIAEYFYYLFSNHDENKN